MPRPALTGRHRICTFGGLALPNGQGTMTAVDLNDLNSWYLQDEALFDVQQQLTMAQRAWLGESVYLASDFPALPLRLPMEYREGATPLGAVLPKLLLAGEQRLAFDASSTCILARCVGTSNRQTSWRMSPLRWTFDLLFMAREPWWRDLAASTYINALALNSGSATNTNVTYTGDVFARPVYTLHIPASNTAPIASFTLANTMSGESMTVTFPGNLAASTLWDVTIDAGAMSVTDQNGHAYDIGGGVSIPLFHEPAGTVQQIQAMLTPASGTATGCTLTAVATNRWLL
jgi:hypothetical protein